MELIFESNEERDEFFVDSSTCPSYIGGRDFKGNMCCQENCARCWEQSGVKYRVKPQVTIECSKPLDKKLERELVKQIEKYTNQPTPDHPVPIEEQDGYITEIVINEPLRPGDRLVKKDGKWCIEKRPEMHIVYPRHCGRTAAMTIIDEFDNIIPPTRRNPLDKLDYLYRYTFWKEAIDFFMDKHDRIKKPQIEKVIFNDPATIVFWKDGTKTVVKCKEGDKFDEEKGLAMAICKKVYGEGYWTGVFKKWVPEESASKRLYAVGKLVSEAMNESMRRATESLKNLEKALDGIATIKRCGTCAYEDLWKEEAPCNSCVGCPEPSNWKPKEIEPLKPCEECKHSDVHEFDEPCRSCSGNSGFEEKLEKGPSCKDCVYSGFTAAEEPCCGCGQYTNFKPKKEEKHPRIERHGTHWRCPNCVARLHDGGIVGRKEIHCPNCGIKLVR